MPGIAMAAAADTPDNDDDFTIYVDYANYSDDTTTTDFNFRSFNICSVTKSPSFSDNNLFD